MIPQLTDEQQRALDASPEAPLRVVDPRTNQTYVLLPLAHYEWIKALFEADPLTPEEQRGRLREAGKRAGWDDPALGVYNDSEGVSNLISGPERGAGVPRAADWCANGAPAGRG